MDREVPNPAFMHTAVTTGSKATITPMLLQTLLRRQEILKFASIIH
jgi:hypothetical protein